MTSHCITWHDTTQAITSHQMTWPSHDLTPEQTSRHQNTSLQSTKHHHHGRAEGSFTAKKWFGHRAGRSPCAHSIGKFFLCYIVLFLLETSAPGLSGHYWYNPYKWPKIISWAQRRVWLLKIFNPGPGSGPSCRLACQGAAVRGAFGGSCRLPPRFWHPKCRRRRSGWVGMRLGGGAE